MSDSRPSGFASDLILYTTEEGRDRIEVRLEDETVWLSLAAIAGETGFYALPRMFWSLPMFAFVAEQPDHSYRNCVVPG